MSNSKKFHGKTVVITGASAGVGRAVSREFAKQGARLALLARGEDGLRGAVGATAATALLLGMLARRRWLARTLSTIALVGGISLVTRHAVPQVASEDQSRAADNQSQRGGAEGTSSDILEHGKYLVHDVAMCIECHSPRDESGDLEDSRLLQGAPVPIESPFPSQQWAFQAPKLAGLPAGFRERDLIELLRTGKGPRGRSPRPPMPPFRMNQRDAEAVAAYVKSVERR